MGRRQFSESSRREQRRVETDAAPRLVSYHEIGPCLAKQEDGFQSAWPFVVEQQDSTLERENPETPSGRVEETLTICIELFRAQGEEQSFGARPHSNLHIQRDDWL